MLARLNILAFVTLALLTLNCKSQKQNDKNDGIGSLPSGINFVIDPSLKTLLEEAKSKNKIIFMDFYAEWCSPCKLMDKEVFSDAEVGQFFNENFINYKVNAEKGSGRDLASLYEIAGYPTLVFVDPHGHVLRREIGLVFKNRLLRIAEESIADLKKGT